MGETTDPRVEFAGRLRALLEATGLSIRRLEVESERTPRRRKEEVVRLKRSTIAGITNRERPVRPELANFEVFVDTCLRVAAEKNISLPLGLGDRNAWDEAYRELRDQIDRYPRRNASQPLPKPSRAATPPAATPPPVEPNHDPKRIKPPVTRRWIIMATPAALAAVAAGVLIPDWAHRPASPTTGMSPSDDTGYSPVGRLLSAPIAKDDPVWSVAIGALRGELLAVVGRGDGTLQLWNPVTGRARSSPLTGHDKPVYSIALSAPIAVSASVDGTLRVWDLTAETPTSVRLGDKLAGGINSVALGIVRGGVMAVSAGDDRTVRLWDPANPRFTGKVLGGKLDSEVNSIAVGTLNGGSIAVSGSTDGTVRLWDVDAERSVRILGAHQATVGTMAIATVRGKTLAVSGGEDGDVRIWDLTATKPTGKILSRINNAVKTVAIGTVNGRSVAISGSDDGAIRIWDLATGRPYGNGLTGPDKGAESIAICDLEGRAVVVSGNWDGTIWTWSL